MIHICFVPGTFGSTIDYLIHCHIHDKNLLNTTNFNYDGSMHLHNKNAHVIHEIIYHLNNNNKIDITSLIYPQIDKSLDDVLNFLKSKFLSFNNDKKIIIYAENKEWAEINILFQYHKIHNGLNRGPEIFFSGVDQKNVSMWNEQYTSWKNMQTWELREWMSLFYNDWIKEWMRPKILDENYLLISNKEVVENSKQTFKKILHHCNIEANKDIEEFANIFCDKQQYILDEYKLINEIVNKTINKEHFSWKTISFVSEAIVQHKLRDKGYEIKCAGLNIFPINTTDLNNIIFKNT